MDVYDTAITYDGDTAVARAIQILSHRWALSPHAAEMALCDIAFETGVDVGDLAELISNSKRNFVH